MKKNNNNFLFEKTNVQKLYKQNKTNIKNNHIRTSKKSSKN
jgi:hypothetical protein